MFQAIRREGEGQGFIITVVFLGFWLYTPHAIPMKGTMETAPATERVPLKLGVYYSPDFRNYQRCPTCAAQGGDRWDFPLGTTSARLFDRVFADMFTSVQSLGSRPPFSGSQAKLDAVLEPKIESFDFTCPISKRGLTPPRSPTALPSTPSVESRWPPGRSGALAASTGRLTLTSSAGRERQPPWPCRTPRLKFVTGFPEIPEVRRLINQAKTSSPK